MGMSTGAATIFANTGGVMEAALRTAYEIVTGRELPYQNIHMEMIGGLKGIKELSFKLEGVLPEWNFLEGVTMTVAVAHGLANAREVIRLSQSGEKTYHFVEIMACPGGCIGGGGQPRPTNDEIRQKRIDAIYREDKGMQIRKSHENKHLQEMYHKFFEKPLSHRSHQFLHTHYKQRDKH
jgi:iron only hydrogenase large subunit-like protein